MPLWLYVPPTWTTKEDKDDSDNHRRERAVGSAAQCRRRRRGIEQEELPTRGVGPAGGRAADGRPRYDDRERRAAVDPEWARLRHQRHRLGRERVRVDVRRPATARGAQR